MGGYHPTFLPQEASENADAIVIGEAELVWEEVVNDARNGRLRGSYQADRLCDLDADVPIPRRDLLDRSRYYTFNTMQATRGCGKGCDFCSVDAFFDRAYRTRSPENVVREIESMLRDAEEAGTGRGRWIVFSDDSLASKPAYAAELFEALIPLKIKWASQVTSAMAKNEELLEIAARSGCRWASIGFESINPDSLAYLNKNWAAIGVTGKDAPKQKREAIREALTETVEAFHRHGIAVLGNFMFGFDEDDSETLRQTIRATHGIGIDAALFRLVTPTPGTKLFDRLDQDQRILTKDWRQYDGTHVVFAPKRVPRDELQDYFWQAYEYFYSWTRIISRCLKAGRNMATCLATNNSRRRTVKRLMEKRGVMR